jgi:RNA polymerase sigma-70 factor, ECF subfamily
MGRLGLPIRRTGVAMAVAATAVRASVYTHSRAIMNNLDYAELSNELLMLEVGACSEIALRELYARFSKQIFSLARRMLRDESAAEDVTQDVFVKIWQKSLDYSSLKGAVSTWIMTIAHHSAVDAIRRRATHETVLLEDGELERYPIEHGDDRLEQVTVSRALETLEPGERGLIELAYFEGLSHSQLAARTGIPLGTIKTRLRVGLQKLKTALGEWSE